MKWLILAVVIFAQQPAKAPEGKGAAESVVSQDAQQSHASQKDKSRPDTPPPSYVQQTISAKPQADAQGTENNMRQKGMDWIEIFTGLLVIIGFLQTGVMYLTWRVYRRQAEIMEQQRAMMQNQWTTMQGQISQMESSGKQTDELIKHAANQVVALTDAAQAAGENAEAARINAMNSENAAIAATANAQATIIAAQAAKTSADIATGVSLPTLVIEEFSAGNATGAALTAMLQLPKVNLRLKNYGQTPGLLKWWSLIFTCEDLPDIPVYDGFPVDRFPASGIVLAKQVIQPNEVYTLTVDDSWRRQHFSIDDVQAIMDRQKTLTAYGYVSYGDIFGNPLRRFKFCETALNFGDGWIDWQSDLAPSGYVGTDQFPSKKAEASQEKTN